MREFIKKLNESKRELKKFSEDKVEFVRKCYDDVCSRRDHGQQQKHCQKHGNYFSHNKSSPYIASVGDASDTLSIASIVKKVNHFPRPPLFLYRMSKTAVPLCAYRKKAVAEILRCAAPIVILSVAKNLSPSKTRAVPEGTALVLCFI